MFSQAVIENLQYYVYFLLDPRGDNVFYIGKGVGNRVFNHMEGAIEDGIESEKLDTIRDIINSSCKVKHYILRHGLTEKGAFEVEAALIDFVGVNNLSNLQGGHYSSDYGLKTAGEIISMYEAEELSTSVPLILVNINKRYDRTMTSLELYSATKEAWVVGSRRLNAEYAIATYRGLTREVYKIDRWYPIERNEKIRWGFDGGVANANIREKLIYKSIKTLFKTGSANPIRYLNC
jgi:hypothetical protein